MRTTSHSLSANFSIGYVLTLLIILTFNQLKSNLIKSNFN